MFFKFKVSNPFGAQVAIFIVGAVCSGGSGGSGGGGGGGVEWTVSLRFNSTAKELSLDMSVPIILYLIVSSSWQPSSNERPPERFSRILKNKNKKLEPNQTLHNHTSLTAIISYFCLNCTSRDIIYWNSYSNFLAELFSQQGDLPMIFFPFSCPNQER